MFRGDFHYDVNKQIMFLTNTQLLQLLGRGVIFQYYIEK